MNKNDIKKLIFSIVFIVFLILFFLFGKNINDNKKIKKITIVKNIVKEKYDNVYYKKDSKYIYTLNRNNGFSYDIFDLHGNRIYSIHSDKELNIIKIMKKYYILYDKEYYLFNDRNEEIASGSVIEGINEYLIKIDNRIINYKNEVLFNDVYDITTFDNNNYLNINNYYLVNKKGEIIEDNTLVYKEINNNSFTDFLIIKKGNKYYTFFINLDKVIGDGFDSYNVGKNILIRNNGTIYKIYKTGLRKKYITISNEIINDYIIDKKYILVDKAFVTRKKDNSFGVIDLKTKKYIKITKNQVKSLKKIDKNNYLIKSNYNILFNIKKNKTIIKTKNSLDNIVLFNNDYKTVKKSDKYILFDKNWKEVYESDKQIIINKDIIAGKIENEFCYYNINNKTKKILNKALINNNTYFYNNGIVYDDKFKKIIKSNMIIFNKNSIMYLDKKKITFDYIIEKKKYTYDLLKGEEIVNNNLSDIILIESDNYLKILDDKGDILKKIRNRKIVNYYYTENGYIIIITSLENDKNIYYGSYIAE